MRNHNFGLRREVAALRGMLEHRRDRVYLRAQLSPDYRVFGAISAAKPARSACPVCGSYGACDQALHLAAAV